MLWVAPGYKLEVGVDSCIVVDNDAKAQVVVVVEEEDTRLVMAEVRL